MGLSTLSTVKTELHETRKKCLPTPTPIPIQPPPPPLRTLDLCVQHQSCLIDCTVPWIQIDTDFRESFTHLNQYLGLETTTPGTALQVPWRQGPSMCLTSQDLTLVTKYPALMDSLNSSLSGNCDYTINMNNEH